MEPYIIGKIHAKKSKDHGNPECGYSSKILFEFAEGKLFVQEIKIVKKSQIEYKEQIKGILGKYYCSKYKNQFPQKWYI